jgi:hypothetical protein
MRHCHSGARRVLGALTIGLIAAVSAASASGGTFTNSATSCSSQVLEQPFLRWVDPASYTLPASGSLETTSGWTLNGKAKLVSGNETYKVHAGTDRMSLSLPPGSSATTRPMCVGLEHPDLRLFVSNSGSPFSTLEVEVLFEDVFGKVRSLPVGLLVAGSSWQPTLPIAFLANVPGSILSANGKTAVAFRFTPQGADGGWRIDDVYVDPFKGR